jgi:antitoxin (DNA-binding transcriptional repressor) of toxin-antitoxin stability system
MKSVQLADLGPVADDVKNGETVEVRDGTRLVATLVPLHQARLEERVQELAARGMVRLGNGEPWPADFFTRPLPKADGSVLEQLLADRHLLA